MAKKRSRTKTAATPRKSSTAKKKTANKTAKKPAKKRTKSTPRKRKSSTTKRSRPAGNPAGGEIDAVLAQREAQALELRIAGASYRTIATRLGVSLSTAHHTVQRVLERTEQEANDLGRQWRQIQVERIERLLLSVWPAATGQPARTDATTGEAIPATPAELEAQRLIVTGHIPQLAKLMGLYSPERLEVTGQVDPIYESMRGWSDEALRAVQAIAQQQDDRNTGDGKASGGSEGRIPRRSRRSFKPKDYAD